MRFSLVRLIKQVTRLRDPDDRRDRKISEPKSSDKGENDVVHVVRG
jgi:hypothetical protein